MKENVLVLTNNIGGLHSFRKEVMKSIIDAGYNLYISEPDNDERVAYFEDIGCIVIKTEFNRRGRNPFSDFLLLIKYTKLIHRIKPLVVLTYTIKPNVYGGFACQLTKTPQLANVTGLGDAIENGGLLQKTSISLYRLGLSKAHRVFFQNKSNKSFCVNFGIGSKDSIVLPGSGVNLDYHKIQPYPNNKIIKFLFIGRLLKDKGIEEFFKMTTIIKQKHPDTEFHILGNCEGNYKQQLEELIRKNIIIYDGTTIDVRPFLKEVHCTIMPSYHEGMSNVNLESAANGRPVITTNVPGCKETVDDGITGYLIKPKSSEDLVLKVESFINLPYEKKEAMGVAARYKVEREFDRNIVVNAYLDEIRKLKV